MDRKHFQELAGRLYDNYREVERAADHDPDVSGTTIVFPFEGRVMHLGFNPAPAETPCMISRGSDFEDLQIQNADLREMLSECVDLGGGVDALVSTFQVSRERAEEMWKAAGFGDV